MNTNTKWTRLKMARVLGAAGVAALMVFTGLALAPAASADNACPWKDDSDDGTNINLRNYPSDKSPIYGLKAKRYSNTSGEITWKRTPHAVKYQILQDGKSLGTHDVLSRYMTGLQNKTYTFEIRAVDRCGNTSAGTEVRLYKNLGSYYGGSYK